MLDHRYLLLILFIIRFSTAQDAFMPSVEVINEYEPSVPPQMSPNDHPELEWRVLYPFGYAAHDVPLVDRPNHETQIDLDFFFPFYGFRFNYTFISPNGLVSFCRSDWIQPPYSFPNPKWPEKSDPSFIAAFLARATFQYTGSTRISNVWQRTVHRSFVPHPYSTMTGLGNSSMHRRIHAGFVEDDDFLDRITADIQSGMNGASGFQALHALVVTWERMAYGGAPKIVELEDYDNAKRWVATQQTTDEIRSYSIFNYGTLNWTSSTDAGSLRGRGGYQSSIAGFNGGNGTGFTPLPYSARGEIFKLASFSSVDVPGRWIYRVDEQIIAGGCSNASAGILSIAPNRATMLGGVSVNISGPCLKPATSIHVLFDEMLVTCNRLSNHRAQCVLPRFHRVGPVVVKLSTDGGRHFPFTGAFYFVPPDRAIPGVILRRDVLNYQLNAFDNPTPDYLTLTWSPYNLTCDPGAMVNIDIFGYWEDAETHRFERVGIIAENIKNTGVYKFSPSKIPRPADLTLMDKWKDYEVGVIRVSLQNNANTGVLYSVGTSLSWYFLPDWEKHLGPDWALKRCINWYEKDGKWRNFWMDLDPCPCTLDQALLDIGRFMPYLECDMNGDGGCYYHRGSSHCVMSTHASWTGGQSVCCYDFDGWLMHSDDYEDLDVLRYYSPGLPYRAHMFGSYPFRMPPYVPTLSNWFHDLAPYHMCCRFADKCTFLFWRRQTRSCQGYTPPTAGIAYGNTHFITFDGAKYRFNGKGYYVLVMSTHPQHRLMVQIRLEQPPQTRWNTYPNSTIITGMAAKENDSDVVQIVARKEFRRWRYKTDVLIRGYQRYFDTFDMKVQQYRGLNIWSPPRNFDQSELHIQFLSGAGVKVREHHGLLDVTVVLPNSFNESVVVKSLTNQAELYRTYGLLGVYNGRTSDDFTPSPRSQPILQNGKNIYTKPEAATLHHEFGEKWRVDGSDAFIGPVLFNDFTQPLNNPLLFSRKDYLPDFDNLMVTGKAALEIKESNIRLACGVNIPCRQTYVSTGHQGWAVHTKKVENEIDAAKESGSQPWLSCGPLWKAVGAIKTPQGNNYLDGVTVEFFCRPEYFAHGTDKRTCINGTWTPGWPVWCRLKTEETALKIATGVITSFLILLLLISVFYYCYRNNVKPKHMVHQKQPIIDVKLRSTEISTLSKPGSRHGAFKKSFKNKTLISSPLELLPKTALSGQAPNATAQKAFGYVRKESNA